MAHTARGDLESSVVYFSVCVGLLRVRSHDTTRQVHLRGHAVRLLLEVVESRARVADASDGGGVAPELAPPPPPPARLPAEEEKKKMEKTAGAEKNGQAAKEDRQRHANEFFFWGGGGCTKHR